MAISLSIAVAGGLVYLASSGNPPLERLGTLGKWAFGIGLAAWLIH